MLKKLETSQLENNAKIMQAIVILDTILMVSDESVHDIIKGN